MPDELINVFATNAQTNAKALAERIKVLHNLDDVSVVSVSVKSNDDSLNSFSVIATLNFDGIDAPKMCVGCGGDIHKAIESMLKHVSEARRLFSNKGK